MNNTHKFIEVISKQVVTHVAPEELAVFEPLLAAYLADPTPPDVSSTIQHDPTSMGLDEVINAVTPAVAAAVKQTLSNLSFEDTTDWRQSFPYEQGFQQLLIFIPRHHHCHTDALLFQAQLIENLTFVHRYGDTAELRADRFRIIEQLNKLSLQITGQSFNSLCGMTSGLTPTHWRQMRQNGIQEVKRFGIQSETQAEEIIDAVMAAFLTILWGDDDRE